jgi:hypothetical protein
MDQKDLAMYDNIQYKFLRGFEWDPTPVRETDFTKVLHRLFDAAYECSDHCWELYGNGTLMATAIRSEDNSTVTLTVLKSPYEVLYASSLHDPTAE